MSDTLNDVLAIPKWFVRAVSAALGLAIPWAGWVTVQLATIGVSPGLSLTLSKLSVTEGAAAARAKLVSPAAGQVSSGKAEFQAGDTVIRVGEVTVKNYRDYAEQLAANPHNPLQITVLRRPANSNGGDENSHVKSPGQELTFEVPAQPMNHLGLVMSMGPVTAIQEGSPADSAGFKVGDQIELVDGQPMATRGAGEEANSWDSMSLPNFARRAAAESREIEFMVKDIDKLKSALEQQTKKCNRLEKVGAPVPSARRTSETRGAPTRTRRGRWSSTRRRPRTTGNSSRSSKGSWMTSTERTRT